MEYYLIFNNCDCYKARNAFKIGINIVFIIKLDEMQFL